jgi:hypothetical protein
MASGRFSVNVRDGFLPHFTPGYLDRYGPNSEFVRAVSDHLTLKLAIIMDRAGAIADLHDVVRISDDKAVRVLRDLIEKVDTASDPLFREALGTAPLGSFALEVDTMLGRGIFDAWLLAFQAREHMQCGEIIRLASRKLLPNPSFERTR